MHFEPEHNPEKFEPNFGDFKSNIKMPLEQNSNRLQLEGPKLNMKTRNAKKI